jgi:hypothetical protein
LVARRSEPFFWLQVIATCVCLSLSAFVTLSLQFLPKIYIILCQPQKNNRRYCISLIKVTALFSQMNTNEADNKSLGDSVLIRRRKKTVKISGIYLCGFIISSFSLLVDANLIISPIDDCGILKV